MVLSRAEFAYLYYPTNPMSQPPYELDPALMWFQMRGESEKGLSRLLARNGGTFHYGGHSCPDTAEVQGENRVWRPCAVRYAHSDRDTVDVRLFGAIVASEMVGSSS